MYSQISERNLEKREFIWYNTSKYIPAGWLHNCPNLNHFAIGYQTLMWRRKSEACSGFVDELYGRNNEEQYPHRACCKGGSGGWLGQTFWEIRSDRDRMDRCRRDLFLCVGRKRCIRQRHWKHEDLFHFFEFYNLSCKKEPSPFLNLVLFLT